MPQSPVSYLFNKTLSDFPAPYVNDWYPHMNLYYAVAIALAVFATVSVIVLGALHLYFVIRYVSHPSMQSDLYWIVLLCPIIAICNGVGVCVPRTAAFLYSVGIVYYIMCTFILLTLMTTLYGSRSAMSRKLLAKDITMNPRVMPIGCCLLCLPNIEPTHRNIRYLEWAVFQSVIVRVIIEIVSIAVFNELDTKDHFFFTLMNALSFLSLTFASYSTYILFPAGCKQLTQYRFMTMFRLIDWTQFFYSIQKYVLEAALALGIFPFTSTLSANATMQFWACFLATIEMLILSIAVTYLFPPSKTAFFDRFPVNNIYREKRTLLPSAVSSLFPAPLDATETDEPPILSKAPADPENNVGMKKEPPQSMKETSLNTTTPPAIMAAERDPEIAAASAPCPESKSPTASISLQANTASAPLSTSLPPA